MESNALYVAHNLSPAYHLRYVWVGWPSGGSLPALPPSALWDELARQWESDGLRLLERRWLPDTVQLLFSARPRISPVMLAARAKGHLQHVLRKALPGGVMFSRKTAVRSMGDNRIRDVEEYIRTQIMR